MRTERRASNVALIALSATVLLWPALWNGYPLVFADTGTYLSQAIERYAGWDRPIFYSFFLLPLHLTFTTWPAIAAQALLVAYTLHLVRRTLLPDVSSAWLLAGAAFLAVATALPWFAAQLVPDIFTALLVLVLTLLALVPDRLSRTETIWLVLFAAFMIAAHLSHVLLAACLVGALLSLRGRFGAVPLGWRGIVAVLAPLVLATAALVSVNAIAFGRLSISPYGNVFLLARMIYDGPAMDTLRRECPQARWRLCASVEKFPALADDFLWRADGPVAAAGGAKRISAEADAIITETIRAEPGTELRAMLHHTLRQLARFSTGDGLQPWPATVTPVITRHFPAFEAAVYQAARQTRGMLAIPPWLQWCHEVVAVLGVIACCAGLLRQRDVVAGFAVATLLALLCNAAITGALSGPHDRYQSRIMWLPPLIALVMAARRTQPATLSFPARIALGR